VPTEAGIALASADDVVDDLGELEAAEYRPHRGEVAKGEMAGAVRLAGAGLGQTGDDLLGWAEDREPLTRANALVRAYFEEASEDYADPLSEMARKLPLGDAEAYRGYRRRLPQDRDVSLSPRTCREGDRQVGWQR